MNEYIYEIWSKHSGSEKDYAFYELKSCEAENVAEAIEKAKDSLKECVMRQCYYYQVRSLRKA